MIGYVTIDKGELKVREYEIYTGYYCGICKYIGKTYGQIPRMSLSYDAALMALLLAAVDPEPDAPVQEHCAVHHIRRKTIIRNRAIEFAGDVMLILAWFKLKDDAQDEGKLYAKSLMILLRAAYRKLLGKHPDLCHLVEDELAGLSVLEQEGCPSLDRAAEPFSRIMQEIFCRGVQLLYGEDTADSPNLHQPFAKIGYHLGKWIYLMDAADDIEENLETGAYNPLLIRYAYDADKEDPEGFRARIDASLRFNLFHYLAILSEAATALDIRKNSGIIENVIYFGLNRRTEEVLNRIKPEKERPHKL